MVSIEVFPGASLLIEREMPRGIYLLIGPSGVGKTIFCKSFVARGLSIQESGIYLSTDEDCERIQASIRDFIEAQKGMKGDLRLVDAYSWRFGSVASTGPFVTVHPANLTEVEIACQKVCQGLSKPRFVFDSITSLAIHSNSDTTLRFLQVVTAKVRRLNALAFFTLIPASHNSKFVSGVKTMFDGIFEMRFDETGWEIARMFRIFSIKGVKHRTRWVLFTINDEGISLVEDSTPRCAWCGGVIPYEPHKEIIEGHTYTFHATECMDNFKMKIALEKSISR